jgi:hypothetical protein
MTCSCHIVCKSTILVPVTGFLDEFSNVTVFETKVSYINKNYGKFIILKNIFISLKLQNVEN